MSKCNICGEQTDNEELLGEIICDECQMKIHEKIDKNIKKGNIKFGEM